MLGCFARNTSAFGAIKGSRVSGRCSAISPSGVRRSDTLGRPVPAIGASTCARVSSRARVPLALRVGRNSYRVCKPSLRPEARSPQGAKARRTMSVTKRVYSRTVASSAGDPRIAFDVFLLNEIC
jgi:hypothetical protein